MQLVIKKVAVSITTLALLSGPLVQSLSADRRGGESTPKVAIKWTGPKRLGTGERLIKGRWVARPAGSRAGVQGAIGTHDLQDLKDRVSRLPTKYKEWADRLSYLIKLHEYETVASSERRSYLSSLGISITRVSTDETFEATISFKGIERAKVRSPRFQRGPQLTGEVPDGAEPLARDEIDQEPILEAESEFENEVAYTIAVEESSEAEAAYIESLDWGPEFEAGCGTPASGPSAPESADLPNCITEGINAVGNFAATAYIAKTARDAIIAAKNQFTQVVDDAQAAFLSGTITAAAANNAIAAGLTAFKSATSWQKIGVAAAVLLSISAAMVLYTCISLLFTSPDPVAQSTDSTPGYVGTMSTSVGCHDCKTLGRTSFPATSHATLADWPGTLLTWEPRFV